MRTFSKRASFYFVGSLALALLPSGCGSDDSDDSGGSAATGGTAGAPAGASGGAPLANGGSMVGTGGRPPGVGGLPGSGGQGAGLGGSGGISSGGGISTTGGSGDGGSGQAGTGSTDGGASNSGGAMGVGGSASGAGGASSGGGTIGTGGRPSATGGATATGGSAGSTSSGGSAGTGAGGVPSGDSVCGVDAGRATGKLQMENLCRGLVSVRSGGGSFLSWRLMGYEPMDAAFNVYRDGTLVNDSPIGDSTNYYDEGAPAGATYTVRVVIDGVEGGDSSVSRSDDSPTPTWDQNYIELPLQTTATYSAGDTSPGDLDGDGEYELVVKEENTPRDPSHDGMTGQPKFAAYELDGTLLWRVDLGVNIRESEHTTPFLVYDFDGDGRAELIVKTAPGTRDGLGAFLSKGPAAYDDDAADHRNSAGRVLSGPEYLTVFSGTDGAELATIEYHAPFGSGDWGDDWGNRGDRYNASAAFLDGTGRPSAVMQRGYYERTTFGAYDYRDGDLSLAWVFDTQDSGNRAYAGQGNHTLMVADGDGDGRQEIIPGGITISPDGHGICGLDFYAHGDALHISDLVPSRPGLEVFQPFEGTGVPAYAVRDVMTCETLWRGPTTTSEGPARGVGADVSPGNPGAETWASGSGLLSAEDGRNVGGAPRAVNFLLWWDGDESRELLDGNTVSQYDGEGQGFTAAGCTSINGSKSVPNLSADLFGDWREEVVFLCGGSLRIYTTTQLTTRRIYTLMHDPQYRMNVSSQNATYNQPPHTGFHIGGGMDEPPEPDINVR